ncbi:MAG: hypothetical protein J3K34DRAFT_524543 [Monoraphidium minutum]|nr:MAG: hypothetical protein J3K34DRAFT_524543 [Monoraphidium minutum]
MFAPPFFPMPVFGLNPLRRACRARAYAPVLHSRVWVPPPQLFAGANQLEVTETADAILVSLDVPGVEPADLKVNLAGGVLTVRGERKAATEADDQPGRIVRSERGSSGFARSFGVPPSIDADAVEAHLANGVLEIRLPKLPKPEPISIPINVKDASEPAADGHADGDNAAAAAEAEATAEAEPAAEGAPADEAAAAAAAAEPDVGEETAAPGGADEWTRSKKHKRSSPDPERERVEAAKAFLQQVLQQGGGGQVAAAAVEAVAAAERQAAEASAARKADRGGRHEAQRLQQRAARPPRPRPPGVGPIGPDDYFSRATEFTAWLQEGRGLFFNNLSSEEAHTLFEEYVEDWNGGHLAPKYYQGLVTAPTKRTTHQWGFKQQGGGERGGGERGSGMLALMADQQQQRGEARQAEGLEKRKWRAEQKERLDEMLPKATGREALVEKRIARREAARAREDSPEITRVTGGGDVMGGDDSFAAAKAREAAFTARRTQRDAAKREVLSAKLSAAQAEEAAKMAQFRALLAHGPISIPKRQ